jgi:starch synthase
MFVVHNFGYQGTFPFQNIRQAVLDLGLDPQVAEDDLIFKRWNGQDGNVLNLTKAALMTADRIVTVSPTYASEVKTPSSGFRLHNVVKMRESSFVGISNGIDVTYWNPTTDPLLAAQYGPTTDFISARAICKRQLQQRLKLRIDPDIAVVSFVGRLTHQKGIDIILQAVDWLMIDTGNTVTGKVQLIIMGNGEARHADCMRAFESRFKGSFCGFIGFDPDIEHIIYGGSDVFLMPSRYEPCGLTHRYAMRYGCIPIVTLCGGLKDSVVTQPPEQATGFGINPLNFDKFKEVTYKALETFHQRKKEFQSMQVRAMQKDFSWCDPMDQYEQHIDRALESQPVGL